MGKIRYQEDSATQIYNRMFRQGCQKYLLADEVGLGKTVTAANVIVKLLEENDGSRPVRIGYICSNLALADQNIRKIEDFVREKIEDVEIFHKKNERIALAFKKFNKNVDSRKKVLIIDAVTPNTGVKVCSGGTLEERSYAYALLLNANIETKYFWQVYKGKAKIVSKQDVWKAYDDINDNYIEFKQCFLDEVFIPALKEECVHRSDGTCVTMEDDIIDRCVKSMLKSISKFEPYSEQVQIVKHALYKMYHEASKDSLEKECIRLCIDNIESITTNYEKDKEYIVDAYYKECIEKVFVKECCKRLFWLARKCMVVASLKGYKVDMFIADEIQNYSEILASISKGVNDHSTEAEVVINEIFGISKVLLLSATPFRYHTKNLIYENLERDEDSDVFVKTSKEDVSNQQKYLTNDTDIYNEFANIIVYLNDKFDFEEWNRLCQEKETSVKNKKEQNAIKAVQCQNNMLKAANVSRIERYMSEIDRTDGEYSQEKTTVNWEKQSVDELIALPDIVTSLSEYNEGSIRMDYIKSTPACLSFSHDYEFKALSDISEKYQISMRRMNAFLDLQLNNPRLKGLYEKLFAEEEGHKLLFIPPIHIPKGRKLSGVFEGKEGFSKRLYFSDYNMTAKSLAGLLSYEASRRVCQDLKKNADANCVEKVPICHMSDGYVDIGELLKYGYERDAIFKHYNKDNISKINIKELLYREDKRYWNILIDKSQEDDKVGIDDNIYKNASPYYYAKEILGIKYDGVIRDFCFAYYTLMTRTDSIRVLCAYSLAETLYESMLHYGYDGVIYSVLSEYKNVAQKDEMGFVDLIKMVSGIRSNPIKCKTITGDSVEVTKEQQLKTGYAIGHYAGDKLKDSTAATTFARKQEVFNSPFWPFNYITTSIGQEGFDFHQYCRIVVHWSLVFDPVRFEQREGRVDRYHSYSNRLNAYELVKEKLSFGSGECDWNKVYDTLKKHVDYQKLVSDSMELFPDFVVPCVRREFGINRETYYLEGSYEHKMLKEVLLGVGYYRSLLGQAGADTFEEKFKEFIEGKEPEEIRKYFLDLRPTPDSDTKE